MAILPTPLPDMEPSDSAARALKKLSQRSTDDLALLNLFYTRIMNTLDYKTSFFLPSPTSPYDPVPKTRTATLQDTGALLTMPEHFAHLVLRRIEGRNHELDHGYMSDEQWKKVETLSARLAAQHPDHVTNVFRLRQEVINIAGKKSRDTILKDLGLLFQHRDDEIVAIMGRLGVSAELYKVEDEEMVITQDEDKEMMITQDEDEDEWETEAE